MRAPQLQHDEIFRAIARDEVALLLQKYFGAGWHHRGDPRVALGVTLEDFRRWVQEHGIPEFILQEGDWSGDNHWVISEQDGTWLFGFAERGTATLWSTHQSLESARAAAVEALWDYFQIRANPEHSGGIASGTSFA